MFDRSLRLRAAALALLLMLSPLAKAEQALGLLLTWQEDPTTTMTIDWYTAPGVWAPSLSYREEGEQHAEHWLEATAVTRPFPFSARLLILAKGGDITYANGDPERIGRWYDWLEIIMNDLVTADGRAAPVIAGIGNHEIFSAHRYDNDGNLIDEYFVPSRHGK